MRLLTLLICMSFILNQQWLYGQDPEKLQMTIKKPYYLSGEDIELEARVFQGQEYKLVNTTEPLYIEWINPAQGQVLNRWVVRLEKGLAKVTIKTDNRTKTGVYKVRAYTNWMRNWALPSKEVVVIGSDYKKSLQTMKEDTLIEVGVEGGELVGGIENRVSISVKNQFKKGIKGVVHVYNQDHELISYTNLDERGLGLITIRPKKGDKYIEMGVGNSKARIEVNQEIGIKMFVDNITNKEYIKVKIEGEKLVERDTIELRISTRGREIGRTSLAASQSVWAKFKKEGLENGIYRIELKSKEKTLSKRDIYIEREGVDSRERKWLLDNELNEELEDYTKLQIDAYLIIKENKLYTGEEKIEYMAEEGLEIRGRVEVPKKVKKILVTLIAKPGVDTLESIFERKEIDSKSGVFVFSNLGLSGKHNAVTLTAMDEKNRKYKINMEAKTYPEVKKENIAIDWEEILKKAELAKVSIQIKELEYKKIDNENIELGEVSVISRKQQTEVDLKGVQPIIVYDLQKTLASTNNFWDFYNQYIRSKEIKYIPPIRFKLYIDGVLVPNDIDINLFNIRYIKFYEGIDAAGFGADFVFNFITKGLETTPQSPWIVYEIIEGYEKNPLIANFYIDK